VLALLTASCRTVLATHPFYALLDEPGHHEDGGNRVCPPPAGYGICKKPQEERKREIRAGVAGDFCTSAPAAVASAIGTNPREATRVAMSTGRSRVSEPWITASSRGVPSRLSWFI
jgi:hypothetical protein